MVSIVLKMKFDFFFRRTAGATESRFNGSFQILERVQRSGTSCQDGVLGLTQRAWLESRTPDTTILHTGSQEGEGL